MVPRLLPVVFLGLLVACPSRSSAEEAAWTTVEVPRNRPFGRSVARGDRVYYFGGGSSNVDVLDTKRRSWSRISTELSGQQLLGDRIGHHLYLVEPSSRRFVKLDLRTHEIHDLPRIPTRRMNGTLVASAGRLYAIGGYSDDLTAENCVEVYDPRSNRWSTGPRLPGFEAKDHFHSAAVLCGKLHVVGGLLASDEGQPHWRLDGRRWTRLADPPLHTTWKHTVLASAADRLVLISALPASTSNRAVRVDHNVHSYDPRTNRWRAVGKAPDALPIGLFAQAVVGDQIFVLGGVDSKRVHVFDVKRKVWE